MSLSLLAIAALKARMSSYFFDDLRLKLGDRCLLSVLLFTHASTMVLVLFFGSLLLACLHFCALEFRPHKPSSSAQDTVLFRDAVVSWWRFLLLPLIVLIMQPVVVRPPSFGKQPRTSS